VPRKSPRPAPVPLKLNRPLAARILADPDLAVLLKPFMYKPMSLKCAADELKIPIQTLHYRAEQMVEAGLLKVEREEARRGRPVKFYRATARAYEVPLECVPPRLLERLEDHASWKRLLEEGLALTTGKQPRQDLLAVYLDDDGSLTWGSRTNESLQLEELAEGEPAVLNFWGAGLRLNPAEAKKFQRELWFLYEKYAHRKGSERYVLHLGLAPHPKG